jgi:hypothetical protein
MGACTVVQVGSLDEGGRGCRKRNALCTCAEQRDAKGMLRHLRLRFFLQHEGDGMAQLSKRPRRRAG